jgi:hypothetical protein
VGQAAKRKQLSRNIGEEVSFLNNWLKEDNLNRKRLLIQSLRLALKLQKQGICDIININQSCRMYLTKYISEIKEDGQILSLLEQEDPSINGIDVLKKLVKMLVDVDSTKQIFTVSSTKGLCHITLTIEDIGKIIKQYEADTITETVNLVV